MEPKVISSPQEFNSAVQDGVTLIDFNAPWCGPCKAQEPILKEIMNQFGDRATIAAMNVDENQEIAVQLGIQSIPTLALFKNGKEIKRLIGLQSQSMLTSVIENALS